MEAKNRIANVQSVLSGRGVLDVKFFFNPAARSETLSAASKSVAYVLERYLDGDYSDMKPIGDSRQEV